MSMRQALLLGAFPVQASVDNGTASVILPDGLAEGMARRYFLLGFMARYSALVAARKIVSVSMQVGGSPLALSHPWDYTNGPLQHQFPVPLHGDYGTALVLSLTASGTPGILGILTAWVAYA